MLTELCQEIKNWFERGCYSGTFTISDNKPQVDFLAEGQYYRVIGSLFNDGVHKFGGEWAAGDPPVPMNDEIFDGAIWSMAIPEAVLKLNREIDAWRAKYEAADSPAMSPYASESFGGYSYSKGGSQSGSSSGSATSWKDAFRGRLNAWRKLQ